MCNKVVCMELRFLTCIPDHFKTQKMYNEAVEVDSYIQWYVPDHLRAQGMCKSVVCRVVGICP